MKALAAPVLLAGLAFATAGCSDQRVTGPGDQPAATWDLVFYSLAGNGWFAETLVLPPNTGGFPERIFPAGRFAQDPSPSPDGTRIAYVVRDSIGYTHLWVANRDGGNAREIGTVTGADEWPSWSPDGSRIAFHSDAAGAGDIYVVNADGSGLQRITFDPLPGITAEVQPAWSPDGSVIAFASTLSGFYDIYTIRPDGSQLRRITHTEDSELEPSWAPAGDRLAIRRVTLSNEWDLSLIGLDGAELRRVALPGFQRAPSWRPDGEALAFSGRPDLGSAWQIFTMPAAGGAPVQQTPASFTGGHRPGWLRRD